MLDDVIRTPRQWYQSILIFRDHGGGPLNPSLNQKKLISENVIKNFRADSRPTPVISICIDKIPVDFRFSRLGDLIPIKIATVFAYLNYLPWTPDNGSIGIIPT